MALQCTTDPTNARTASSTTSNTGLVACVRVGTGNVERESLHTCLIITLTVRMFYTQSPI